MNIVNNDDLYIENQLVIDVRSPGEYQAYHIVDAINLPLFDNEERADIGTTYKRKSTEEAKKLGVNYISKKLPTIIEAIMDYSNEYDRVILYCERGGMRSESIVSLLNVLGLDNVYKLDGGIKGHRQYVLDQMPKVVEDKIFVTLHGYTGVGKTKILVGLDNLTVLDYEGMAQHAGSAFGEIMYPGNAPTQKQFEEMIFDILKHTEEKYIFIEAESKRVGYVTIPDIYLDKLSEGKHILIETNTEKRISNLLEDYDQINDESLIFSINNLRKRISNKQTDILIQMVHDDNYHDLVEYLLLDYYDPLYQYSMDKYKFDKKINYMEIEEAIEGVLDFYNERKV